MRIARSTTLKQKEFVVRPTALQHRRGRCWRGPLSKRLAVTTGGAALRIVPGEFCARHSSARIRRTHRAAWPRDGRPHAVYSRGSFAQSASASTFDVDGNRVCKPKQSKSVEQDTKRKLDWSALDKLKIENR